MSEETTWNRALINTKFEDLSENRYQRLHLILGDSLMSQLGTFLKVGTTAVLLKLLERGEPIGDGLKLANPLRALRKISQDPACRDSVELADGRAMTAIEIQRSYLKNAQKYVRNDSPRWAKDVLSRWTHVLNLLEEDPRNLGTMLDSYIKYVSFSRFLDQRGMSWEDLMRHGIDTGTRTNLSVEGIDPFPIPDMPSESRPAAEAASSRESSGLSEEQKILRKLIEMDIRYHDIDTRSGLFSILERAGLLSCQVVSKKAIAEARESPPTGTRAEVRGREILSLTSDRKCARASWIGIWLPGEEKFLAFSDPFSRKALSTEMSEFDTTVSRSPALMQYLSGLRRRYSREIP